MCSMQVSYNHIELIKVLITKSPWGICMLKGIEKF